MEDSEVKTQIADIQEQSVAPVTPTEPTVAPTVEPAVASKEPTETAGKEVSTGVQKRIDQMASKYYVALDDSKKAVARAKELEEENARLKSAPAKEVSMFEEPDVDEEKKAAKAELAALNSTVAQLKRQRELDEFAATFEEIREKHPLLSFEDGMAIVNELSADNVPPTATGVIEHYFTAREKELLQTRLQDKETKIERKQAVTEGKSIPADEHFPDDTIEAVALLKKDPAKYEELAKKAGLRG